MAFSPMANGPLKSLHSVRILTSIGSMDTTHFSYRMDKDSQQFKTKPLPPQSEQGQNSPPFQQSMKSIKTFFNRQAIPKATNDSLKIA